MKLTQRAIEKTAAAAKDVWLWDDEVPGFGVRIQPSGRKTFVARYRTQAGIQRKTTVARCCDMAPEKARDLARKAFAAVADGKDPVIEKKALRAVPTLTELSERYMKEHAKPFKKAGSVANDERLWRLHILPAIGAKRIDVIERADVLALQASLAEKPATANACVALLSKAFNLAEEWGLRKEINPCRHVKKYKIRERETILAPEQITALDASLTELETASRIERPTSNLLRLLLLTGCRLNEIMAARQAWVDRKRKLLLLPDSKVGQRRIALSDAAMAIIETVPEGEWLIPGARGEHMQNPHRTWNAIKAHAGLPAELRLHDLRHTAGSMAHMAGLTQKQVATMLGHRQLSTTERYLHGFAADSARAVDTVGRIIAGNFGRQAQAQHQVAA